MRLRFRICQHSRDIKLINSIIKYLNCGMVEARSKLNFVELVVTKFSDIEHKIIPFFHKYPIQGIKSLDYKVFCTIAAPPSLFQREGVGGCIPSLSERGDALLIKDKAHLTVEGFEKNSKD
uniref:LAGLIDADG endonuclease n=1 Tax=Morchella brunnea TaxID=1174671 RepID=A0A8K1I7I1_9PEZI|nr:LAGLIDADG endonuclease [Morchella brunnea]UBU98502.1 LAGLIDADG endonuclease [Morchella brunnea]